MTTTKRSSGYMPTLDGWRAFAILMVMQCHNGVPHVGGTDIHWFQNYGGRYGVGLFFVLSGLLICSRLLQEESLRGRIDLKGFYIRRLCRIQPAAFVYLGFLGLLVLCGAISRTNNGILSALFLTRNYIPPISHGDYWYTTHFWSLAIEEHYYLFVPALLILVRPRWWRAGMFGALLVVLYRLRMLVGTPAIPNWQTDIEGAAILLGGLAAVLLADERIRGVAKTMLPPWLVLPVALGIWIRLALHFSRFDPELRDLSFALMILSTLLHPESVAGRVLESAPAKFLGRISYSVYLWQTFFLAGDLTVHPEEHSGLLHAIHHSAWRFALILGAALASYFLVEKPMIKLGHRLARPATPGRDDLDEPPGLETVSKP